MAARITARPSNNQFALAEPIMVEGDQLATAVYREYGYYFYAQLSGKTIVPFDPPIEVPQGDDSWSFGSIYLHERAATPLREERKEWSRILYGMSQDDIDTMLDTCLDLIPDGDFFIE